jgi:hypothetical protein
MAAITWNMRRARGRRQFEIIPQAHKRDAQRFKVSQQVDQMLQ